MNDYNAAKKYGDQQQPLITNNLQGKQRKTASTQKKTMQPEHLWLHRIFE